MVIREYDPHRLSDLAAVLEQARDEAHKATVAYFESLESVHDARKKMNAAREARSVMFRQFVRDANYIQPATFEQLKSVGFVNRLPKYMHNEIDLSGMLELSIPLQDSYDPAHQPVKTISYKFMKSHQTYCLSVEEFLLYQERSRIAEKSLYKAEVYCKTLERQLKASLSI